MTTPTYNNNYRRNLELYWRKYYPDWIVPNGYHVHHIRPKCTFEDKNDPRIHHPRNLIALHPDDHVSIHECRGDSFSKAWMTSIVGHKHTKETKLKISNGHKGQKAWNKGIKLPPRDTDWAKKISVAKEGHTPSAVTKNKIADKLKGNIPWNKGKTYAKHKCPHCLRLIGINNFSRFHNNNCKKRVE